MKKRIIGSLCIALMFVFVVSSFAVAQPAQNKTILSTEDISQLKANMTKDGVIDETTQNKLIAKLQNGETLDCMDPVKTAEASKNLIATKDNPRAEYIFEDGSYIFIEVNVVEAPDLDSFESDDESGLERWNYIANASAGTALLNANFNAYINIRDGYDDIEGLGTWYIYVWNNTWTVTDYSITRQVETATQPATARLTWKITNGGTCWLQLNVKDDGWYSTFQL